MKYDDFANVIENWPYGDYVVRIAYRYDFEENEYITNEIFEHTPSYDSWLNDWWEGQEHIKILGFINVDAVKVPEFEK